MRYRFLSFSGKNFYVVFDITEVSAKTICANVILQLGDSRERKHKIDFLGAEGKLEIFQQRGLEPTRQPTANCSVRAPCWKLETAFESPERS
jgi:hypothetical protein